MRVKASEKGHLGHSAGFGSTYLFSSQTNSRPGKGPKDG